MSIYSHTKSGFSSATGFAIGKKGVERTVINDSGVFLGTSLGVGNVYLVVNTASSSYSDISDQLADATYNDGSSVLHPHTSSGSAVTLNGLKSALAACVADRNDYVVVMPSSTTYFTDEALSISTKGTHLICTGGLGCSVGATNAARLQQITANTGLISITAASVEVAGLYLKHSICATATFGTLGSAIDLSTNSHCMNIHHNYFAINGSGATNSPIITVKGESAGHGAWGQIQYNRFQCLTGGTTWANIINVIAGALSVDISYNDFNVACGTGVTITSIVAIGALYNTVNFNTFTCGADNASYGITESTVTNCISLLDSSVAIGNRGAVQSGRLLAGGVAGRSFCDNLDGRSTSGTDIWNLED